MVLVEAHSTTSELEEVRVAGYDILDEVVRAPGTRMVRACSPTGRIVLLQLAFCRAPATPEEKAAWFEVTKRIECATSEVRARLLPGILHHGITVQNDGTSVLFWALPWHDAVRRIGHAQALVRNVDDLLAIAIDLLEILAARHDAGWIEPLLSESTIIVGAGEPARIAGVPIYVDPEWEATELSRRAPEEITRRHPSRTGDLWRLGRTLAALSRNVELPGSVRAVIESLASPDPRVRPSSAQAVLANLKRMVGRTSGVRWSDPHSEEPTQPSIPALVRPQSIPQAWAFQRLEAVARPMPVGPVLFSPADLAVTAPPFQSPTRLKRRTRSERILTVAVQAFGVFVASALITLGALELLS